MPKKKHILRASAIGLLLFLAYLIPIAISSAKAQPLYGNFDIGTKCLGGHEIFLYLDENQAFENCPGHQEMSLMSTLQRGPSSVTILGEIDNAPWIRVDFDGSSHSFVFLNQPEKKYELPQMNNPWKLWGPRLFAKNDC